VRVPDDRNVCPFCEIAGGLDTSVEIVCEAASWVAFFPLEPATPGHTLLIPRQHVPDYWHASEDVAAELAKASVRIGQAIQAALTPEGMNLITSAGEAAEQTVFHLHIHLVPRWHRDGFGRIWPPGHKYEDATLEDFADRIRAACR
jgi:histidine triad (HIT) family protein